MNIVQSILDFFQRFGLLTHTQTSSEIAQKTLKKWRKLDIAFTQLAQANTPTVASLEAACMLWGKMETGDADKYMHLFQHVIQHISAQRRDAALRLATDNDPARLASLLIQLAPLRLEGYTALATAIKQEWDRQQRNDDLALAFYRVAVSYGVPHYNAVASQIRVLIARRQYKDAEVVLAQAFMDNALPPADLYWSFLSLGKHVNRAPESQITLLERFIQLYLSDQRLGQAWKMIGDFSVENDVQKALNAYLHAEQYGLFAPQLHAYRAGDWDAIPALRSHRDYAYPPIVVIDLEVDPAPGASKGSRVFEVAAARYKGQTCVEHYQSYIKRTFLPAKWTRETAPAQFNSAPPVDVVVQQLRQFLGDALVVGHNISAFDALELKGMGILIEKERIIDTLILARLLHPDSIHHHLAILCQHYHIPVEQKALHSALPDAQACSQLFHALGDSLLQREQKLLTGIRALVLPDSAFDRAVLQPRGISADPSLVWELDPARMFPHIITPLRGNLVSPAMQAALQEGGDSLVEHTDFDANYSRLLSPNERSLVTVSSRTRIERLLMQHQGPEHIFVLPHPQTLLCPHRLRQAIEAASEQEQKLALFCLYQASHNHDAATLYPLRLPAEALDDPALSSLRQTLLSSCCSSEPGHAEDCPARRGMQGALTTHRVLVSTHKNLLARQTTIPDADTIVVDDIADLQMHLPEYSAYTLTSRQMRTWLRSAEEQQVVAQLDAQIFAFATAYIPEPSYRERLSLSSLLAYLGSTTEHPVLTLLQAASQRGAQIANVLQKYLLRATQKPASPEDFHAYWIDLWFTTDQNGKRILQQWEIYGLSQKLRDIFWQRCWHPYKKHILAGSALTVGVQNRQFLQRCLGLPERMRLRQDPRTKKRVYLPQPEVIPPVSFLQRRKWILSVGTMLATWLQEQQRIMLVTLNNTTAADALVSTFLKTRYTQGRQLLASQLNWSVSKINERMADPERRLLVFASPRLRQTVLAHPVDLEVSGPLRFLNKRDPVVAAQMQVFAHLDPQEGPFHAYLLPQALLELKMRLSSEAREYVICDGSLLTESYRDEVLQLLHEDAEIHELAAGEQPVPAQFIETLSDELAQRGLEDRATISDTDLHLMLRTIWDTDTFRAFPSLEKGIKPVVTQKDVVRAALEGKDQLVIAATGGGKSLCFQLPAIILAEDAVPRVTLVFSPLIALMSNQVEQLNNKGIFSAIMLNSTLSLEQRQEHLEGLKKGLYSIVYLAPEQIYSAKLREALQHREIGLIAIDEAHCLSQWGHNFRTDYLMVSKWISRVLCRNQKREFPILALTATARKGYKDRRDETRSDQASTVEDIIEKLALNVSEDEIVLSSAIRPELVFHFKYITLTYTCPQCKHTYEYQREVGDCPACKYHPSTPRHDFQQRVMELKKQPLLALLSPDPQHKKASLPDLYPRWSQVLGKRQRGLIYCAYRKTTEEVAAYLKANIPHLRIGAYHAGMEIEEREEILRRFTSDADDGLDIIVATNAFGMGIDVRRLGFVIHADTPATPEAYYQEAGRAGRDKMFKEGKDSAACILLFHPSDLEKQRFLSSRSIFSDYEIEDVYKAICDIYEYNRDYLAMQGQETKGVAQTNEALHVFASGQEIAMRAGVEEDQVNTLLYYLEEHTTDRVRQRKVLERGEHSSNIWQLRFEREYQTRVNSLPPASPSWPLLRIFYSPGDYHLTTARFTTISARELAESLHVPLKSVEKEILNLVKRRIVTYAGSGQFKLHDPVAVLQRKLTDLEAEMKKLFRAIDKRYGKEWKRNGQVSVNIRSMLSQQAINTVTMTQLTRFLFRYSLEAAEPLRLLERIHRVTRQGQPDSYELRFGKDASSTILQILHKIIEQLRETVDVLSGRIADQTKYNDWHVIDLFAPDLDYDYGKRRQFHQSLLTLEILGLLKYISDPAMGQSMHLMLVQPPVPIEQLRVNLYSLRLQERYAGSKRKLMEQYATTPQKEHYAQQFAMYFRGASPLLEQSQQMLRHDLSVQQRQIATLKDGIHVVTGPAGCGKTTTLAEHVKYLVNQHVPIDHIFITTHYRAAEAQIGEALKDMEGEGAAVINTTINAFGDKIFKQYHTLLRKPDGTPYYGDAREVQLLKNGEDEREVQAINRALNQITRLNLVDLITHHGWPWPQGVEIPQFGPVYRPDAVKEEQFLHIIHRFRQYGIFPTKPPTREELVQIVGEQTGVYSISEYYAVYMVFLQIMAEHYQYTFDDQILLALAILRTNPDILREYQRYFEHIIIDELQDFSPAKVELLLLLCEKRTNIMAFGDIFQEIQFERGKTSKNGKGIKSRGEAEVVFSRLIAQESCGTHQGHQLNINYRSTQEILDLSSLLRTRLSRDMPVHLQSATEKHGPKPAYLYTKTSALTDLLGAGLEQIEQLSASEKESIALIFGNKEMLHPAQNVLKQRHIPFSLMDGQKTLYQLHYVKNVLLYLHLILDKNRDDEVERLLRYNIVPYIEKEQIKSLKSLANDTASSLFEALSSPLHLQVAKISKEQQESLQRHLEIINRYHSYDLVSELANDLEALSDGPLTLLEGQDEKRKEVKEILRGFSNNTIKDALDDIQSHITFLDTNRHRSAIVLTTVNYAKSQEFETVFLLGVDKIFDKRLYVAVSRAKQRLFFVGDTNALTSSNSILGQIPKSLYTEIYSTQTRMTDDKKTERDELTYLLFNEELKRQYFLE